MKKVKLTIWVVIMVLIAAAGSQAKADTFGAGNNVFNIDFVPISGDASSANGTNISGYPLGHERYKTFSDPGHGYRIGTYEITNDQWNKFKAAYGMVTGNPTNAYDSGPLYTGTNLPTNDVSWYEAAQFVNFLNTSTGHQAAYKFTGTIHTSDYTLDVWGAEDADGANLYRNKNAYYFLPTEDEWVKAAYWNGTSLQKYATKAGETLHQGGMGGTGWNYYDSYNGVNNEPYGPWVVGSGSEELNGTYDMMGNMMEWNETLIDSKRCIRGGSYSNAAGITLLGSSYRFGSAPYYEYENLGFRVASIPEPATLILVCLGGLGLRRQGFSNKYFQRRSGDQFLRNHRLRR